MHVLVFAFKYLKFEPVSVRQLQFWIKTAARVNYTSKYGIEGKSLAECNDGVRLALFANASRCRFQVTGFRFQNPGI